MDKILTHTCDYCEKVIQTILIPNDVSSLWKFEPDKDNKNKYIEEVQKQLKYPESKIVNGKIYCPECYEEKVK